MAGNGIKPRVDSITRPTTGGQATSPFDLTSNEQVNDPQPVIVGQHSVYPGTTQQTAQAALERQQQLRHSLRWTSWQPPTGQHPQPSWQSTPNLTWVPMQQVPAQKPPSQPLQPLPPNQLPMQLTQAQSPLAHEMRLPYPIPVQRPMQPQQVQRPQLPLLQPVSMQQSQPDPSPHPKIALPPGEYRFTNAGGRRFQLFWGGSPELLVDGKAVQMSLVRAALQVLGAAIEAKTRSPSQPLQHGTLRDWVLKEDGKPYASTTLSVAITCLRSVVGEDAFRANKHGIELTVAVDGPAGFAALALAAANPAATQGPGASPAALQPQQFSAAGQQAPSAELEAQPDPEPPPKISLPPGEYRFANASGRRFHLHWSESHFPKLFVDGEPAEMTHARPALQVLGAAIEAKSRSPSQPLQRRTLKGLVLREDGTPYTSTALSTAITSLQSAIGADAFRANYRAVELTAAVNGPAASTLQPATLAGSGQPSNDAGLARKRPSDRADASDVSEPPSKVPKTATSTDPASARLAQAVMEDISEEFSETEEELPPRSAVVVRRFADVDAQSLTHLRSLLEASAVQPFSVEGYAAALAWEESKVVHAMTSLLMAASLGRFGQDLSYLNCLDQDFVVMTMQLLRCTHEQARAFTGTYVRPQLRQ